MNTRFRRAAAMIAVSLFAPAVISLPVYARDGESGSDSGSGTSGSTSQTPKTPSTEKPDPKQLQEIESAKDANKSHGKEILDEAKKGAKESTKEDRLKKCEGRKEGLSNKLTNYQKNAQKHLTTISDVFTKAIEAQKTGSLVIVNFGATATTATVAKDKAIASVEALVALSPNIDCTKDTAASDIAVFKAAAEQAKTDLKAYRDAVKSIVVAIEAVEVDKKAEGTN